MWRTAFWTFAVWLDFCLFCHTTTLGCAVQLASAEASPVQRSSLGHPGKENKPAGRLTGVNKKKKEKLRQRVFVGKKEWQLKRQMWQQEDVQSSRCHVRYTRVDMQVYFTVSCCICCQDRGISRCAPSVAYRIKLLMCLSPQKRLKQNKNRRMGKLAATMQTTVFDVTDHKQSFPIEKACRMR